MNPFNAAISRVWKHGVTWCLGLTLLSLAGCSTAPKPATTSSESGTPTANVTVKKLPAGQQFSGFLKDYDQLKPNPTLGGEAMTYVVPDKMKSLHRYFAVIVDPVDVYVATNADQSLIPDRASHAVAAYFRHALIKAVEDAFPVVDTPGPMVLRLRSAIVGVDLGGDVAPVEGEGESALKRAIVLEKVGVEMELVDSVTGERIAAAVDKTNLGAGAQVGSVNFSRSERFAEAKAAFNEWASRLREFLDNEHQLTGEDAAKADAAYKPYGQ